MSQTKHCARHPETETNLSCGRCESAICPRCMVHAPVGVRCPDCAQMTRLPTFEVSRPYLARAVGAGLGLAVAGGILVGILSWLLGWLLVLIGLVGVGYVVGEGISLVTNRKRGRPLKMVAAGAVFLAFVIISSFTLVTLSMYGFLAAAIAIYVAMNKF